MKAPIETQVQLFASIVLDSKSGAFIGQFTNADRNRDPSRCSIQCPAGQVCRLHPKMECALPSDPAGSVDEYPDYYSNPTGDTGYTFTARGCVVDEGEAVTFHTVPVDVAVKQPAVTLRNASLSASFKDDGTGTLRATGSFSADDVLLGTSPSGPSSGNLTARSLTAKEAPPGIPPPPSAADGGT